MNDAQAESYCGPKICSWETAPHYVGMTQVTASLGFEGKASAGNEESGRVPHTPGLRVRVLTSPLLSYRAQYKQLRPPCQTGNLTENFFRSNLQHPNDLFTA